jgi:hypothetical protein
MQVRVSIGLYKFFLVTGLAGINGANSGVNCGVSFLPADKPVAWPPLSTPTGKGASRPPANSGGQAS